MSAPVLRLVADDLTGALDTAAEFAALCGPVAVRWDATVPARGSLAISTATREAPRETAIARARAAAALLMGADIAFRKLDSLLRGHPAAELAACLQAGGWRSVVLAPAFPAQGRATRGGRQVARQPDGAWQPVAKPLPALLAAEGLACRLGDPTAPLPPGITAFDAETEADLARIVACGRAAPGPVLWCGSGGLGRALAAATPSQAETRLRAPVLGLFGSDQPATARQLAACGPLAVAVRDDAEALRVAACLDARGAALVSFDLPPGTTRDGAARRIARGIAQMCAALPRPGTLLVAGGETLGAVCAALGARAIEARGLLAPGVPRGLLRGGAWDGLDLVSKSGAFGEDALWRDLLAANGISTELQTT